MMSFLDRLFQREPPSDPGTRASTPVGAQTGASPLATPSAPRGDRLNRNALTILASFAGMGVIAMVVFIQPSPPNTAARAEALPAQAGTYLDQPVRQVMPPGAEGAIPDGSVSTPGAGGTGYGSGPAGAAPGAYDAAADQGNSRSATGQGNVSANLAPGYGPLPPTPEPYPGTYPSTGDHASDGSGNGSTTLPRPTVAELRAAAYRRALDASPTGEMPIIEHLAGTSAAGAAVAGEEGASDLASGGALPAAMGPATRAEQFMQTAALGSGQRTVQALTVQSAPGPYTVQAGTIIPAVLMTEINSDLAGECLAQITRDVYDTRAQRFLLIPRGSKLLCRYDDQLATGQSRLLVAWTRILLPDGRSISLPGLPATDAAGARGVSDQVDRHAKKAFGTAAALSLIGAGVQLAQPQRGSVFAPPSTGEVMAGALGQELNQVAVEMLRRDMTNRQTIRIRQGVEFNVFLNTDLTFPGPYAATRSDGGVTATRTTSAITGKPVHPH